MNYICHSADFSMVIIITGKTLHNAKPSPRTLLGFRIFFAAQSISKLSRSPEFFRRDCKSLTKYINRVSPQSHKGTDVLEGPQQPQQQPELFFFLLFLDFTAEPVFTAAAAELAGITKLALAISDIACPS